MFRLIRGVVGLVLASAAAGCAAAGPTGSALALEPQGATGMAATRMTPSTATLTTKYVQLVIFENESASAVIGSPQAPYLTGLSKSWAYMSNSHAIGHPSEPNYLALFSGSTQGVTSDACPLSFTAHSLGGELLAAGDTFTGYAESMPSNGFTGCQAVPDSLPSGWLYMRKHVPWTDFKDVPAANSVVYPGPLSAPPSQFTWITPNMCNDMHDCSIKTGDTWASTNLPKLIAWDQANDGVLIVTFDENDGSAGNQIATILAGNVNPGTYTQKITHYNVLRTIENVFGLAALGKSASATPIQGVLK